MTNYTCQTDRAGARSVTNKDFHQLRLTAKASANLQKLTFSKVEGADGYIIYGAPCGNNEKLTKLVDLAGKTTGFTHTGLMKATYYKYQIKAYKMINEKREILAVSKTIYSITSDKTYANPMKITTDSSLRKLALGSSQQIVARIIISIGKKLYKTMGTLHYESSDKEVAMVDKNGMITAISIGSCYIYVYVQNGVYARTRVVVK